MGYFNFDPFRDGRIPPFGFTAKPRDSFQSADIEDVEYVDITDEKPSAPAYDKKARSKQIMDKAFSESESLDQDPAFKLTFITCFHQAAIWADEHPESSFPSKFAQLKAFDDFVKKEISKMKGILAAAGEDKFPADLEMLFILLYQSGFHWATENPPKKA